jgi:hypothetical protein
MLIRIDHHPARRQLTVFGLTWLVLFAVLGGIAWWKADSWGMAATLWTVGIVLPALGCIWPGLLRIVYLVMAYATLPIGWVVSYLLLAAVYYLVLTPIGLALRLAGYDPMARRFDRRAETYWSPREEEPSTDRYFRQY